MVVHGSDKVETRILLWPSTVVYRRAHCTKKMESWLKCKAGWQICSQIKWIWKSNSRNDIVIAWKEHSAPSCNFSSCFSVTIIVLSQSICKKCWIRTESKSCQKTDNTSERERKRDRWQIHICWNAFTKISRIFLNLKALQEKNLFVIRDIFSVVQKKMSRLHYDTLSL